MNTTDPVVDAVATPAPETPTSDQLNAFATMFAAVLGPVLAQNTANTQAAISAAVTAAQGPKQATYIEIISDPNNPANPKREAAINAGGRIFYQNSHCLNHSWSIMTDAEIAALARLRPGRDFVNGLVDVVEKPHGDGRTEVHVEYRAGDSTTRTLLKGECRDFLTLINRLADEAEERERVRLEGEAARVRAFMKDGTV